ncbi:MAG: ferrous iron transport protein A [Candidatus Cloacimonetes bacterium]|nr:ferrous iron transport protein A [Candidatus Cloacimonadota bacterium]
MRMNKNRNRLRDLGRSFLFRPRRCQYCKRGDCVPLTQLQTGQSALVSRNSDLRSIERGMYHGMQVNMFRNEPGEPNLIVAVGDARYVLDRRIAALIMVRVV